MFDPGVLSAVSLMVSAIGLTLGLWRNDIDAARQVRISPVPADRLPAIGLVRAAYRRLLALSVIAWLLVLTFLPPVLDVIRDWTWRPYDPIATAFVIVYGVAVTLATVSTQSALAMRRKLGKLTAP